LSYSAGSGFGNPLLSTFEAQSVPIQVRTIAAAFQSSAALSTPTLLNIPDVHYLLLEYLFGNIIIFQILLDPNSVG
jgi:hypothetical protein